MFEDILTRETQQEIYLEDEEYEDKPVKPLGKPVKAIIKNGPLRRWLIDSDLFIEQSQNWFYTNTTKHIWRGLF